MAEAPRRLTVGRLRLMLGLLFAALALPGAVLVWQARAQIQFEAFHQYRGLADELAQRVDGELQRVIEIEESRSWADYRFLVQSGDPTTSNYVHLSPLAEFPVRSEVPGVIGWFQVDADGAFSSPVLPAQSRDLSGYGIGTDEIARRVALRDRLRDVLSENQLVGARQDAGNNPLASSSFDQLASLNASQAQSKKAFPRVSDLKLDEKAYQSAAAESADKERKVKQAKDVSATKSERALRKEQAVLPDAAGGDVAPREGPSPPRLFESDVAPFESARLPSGHFVLYRNVWREGRRLVQGLLIDQAAFIEAAMARPFREGALAEASDLLVAFQGDVLQVVPGSSDAGYSPASGTLQGELLEQVRLSAPLADFQLIWKINRLPAGPGGRVVGWASAVLFLVLVAGFVALERGGARQVQLAAQQRDFVSAVSHELKTPLTSIRMYGEMLREGWVTEEKKSEYYRFIFEESERLSRLIANVLQLARLERNDLALSPRRVKVRTLVDLMRSKLVTQVERAGFTCEWSVDERCADVEVDVDADALAQIVINLVDNALKFAAGATARVVELGVRCEGDGHVLWSVRDHGPGVPKDQQSRIFQLFYRPGSELTRRTPGTGIGLALARQLARAMNGDVRLSARTPGAEFEIVLPPAAA